jgi:hypothetical protein
MNRFLLTGIFATLTWASFAQVPFTSSNLPIIVIETTGGKEIVDDPKIDASLGIIYNGAGARNNTTDAYNNYNGKMGIEIRGSSSQMFPKKQYGVNLWDDAEEDVEASLLGLPKEEDWIFFAPYNDKTLMRDVLAYKLAGDMGHYAPRTRFTELVLNGTYNGVYVLIEKIKRDKNRVNIEKLDPEEITAPAVTGGYIIKIDKTSGDSGEGWYSTHTPPNGTPGYQRILFQYEYPKYDDISAQQKTYIQNYVSQFENALAGENFKDPVNGYAKYIDMNSFVDFMLMMEVTRNVDGYRLSTFFQKDSDANGGKLKMGPVWDFNLGFGNANYCDGDKTTGYAYNFNTICNNDQWLNPFWWERLLQDQTFNTAVIDRWTALRAGKFKTETVLKYVDSVASVLSLESQQRNFQRWPEAMGQWIWPNAFVGKTYEEEVLHLKQWISNRMSWLDSNIPKLALITANETALAEVNVSAAPNPFAGNVTWSYSVTTPGVTEIEVFNSLGSNVHHAVIEHREPGEKTYSQSNLGTSGNLYYYVVKHNKRVVGRGKLLRN